MSSSPILSVFKKVHLLNKILRDRSKLPEESQKRVLSSFFDSFALSYAKRLAIKGFLEVSLVSLTLKARTIS